MDIFIPLRSKAVKFSIKGFPLDQTQIEKLRAFKFSKVLIRQEDETIYRSFLEESIEEAESNTSAPIEARTETMAAASENAAQEIIEKPESKEVYQQSYKQFERFGAFLNSYEAGAAMIIKNAGLSPPDYVSHGAQTATLSLVMAEKLGLLKQAWRKSSLIAGCLLHDIALEQGNIPLGEEALLDDAQKLKWRSHPSDGARILGDKDYVDRQVIDIILQHEECGGNGTGFPRGLKSKDMDAIARVVAIANRFDHHCIKAAGDKKLASKNFMVEELGKYDFDLVELLQKTVSDICK